MEGYNYEAMFEYIRARNFVPEPYISSSEFGLRAGQYDPANFTFHMRDFKRLITQGVIERVALVFNARADSLELRAALNFTVTKLFDSGWKRPQYTLILSVPQLLEYYYSLGFHVCASSASLSSYKRLADVLTDAYRTIPLPEDPLLDYVLPSTCHYMLNYGVLAGRFTLLLNNGCALRCVNAGTAVDHSLQCPIANPLAYAPENIHSTDIISREQFDKLRHSGWNTFKIAGRQADPKAIFDTVKYYLDDMKPPYVSSHRPPYIDNHIYYGESSNG